MLEGLEIDPEWFVRFIDEQGCSFMGCNGRNPKIKYYNSIDGRRIVIIDTTEDLVDGVTITGWLISLGLEEAIELVGASFPDSIKTPYVPRVYPDEFYEAQEGI